MTAIVAFSIALLSGAHAEGAPFQVLAGPTFEALARRTDTACPDARVRFIKPGDLDWEEDVFEEGLPASDQAKFRAAIARTPDGAPKPCADRNGISCSAVNNLEAIDKAGQMGRFVAFVCVTKPPG